MAIRKMNFSDLQAVQNLNIRNLPENYVMQFYIYQLGTNPDLCFVYCNESRVVAYIMGKTDVEENIEKGHIISLCVEKEYRRKGIAKMLLQNIVDMYKIKSIKNYRVGLKVRISNNVAIDFYSKNGFNIVSTENKYYGDNEDAYTMEIVL
ncbi:N-terminal acetyltransferase A complex catalytic subunit ard1 [Conglomerata obtusa]